MLSNSLDFFSHTDPKNIFRDYFWGSAGARKTFTTKILFSGYRFYR
jgi:hypothetical protein